MLKDGAQCTSAVNKKTYAMYVGYLELLKQELSCVRPQTKSNSYKLLKRIVYEIY